MCCESFSQSCNLAGPSDPCWWHEGNVCKLSLEVPSRLRFWDLLILRFLIIRLCLYRAKTTSQFTECGQNVLPNRFFGTRWMKQWVNWHWFSFHNWQLWHHLDQRFSHSGALTCCMPGAVLRCVIGKWLPNNKLPSLSNDWWSFLF